MKNNNLVVVAIGGNSLIKDKQHQSVEDQRAATAETCGYIADLIAKGWRVVVTHGNGPQVGFILLRSDLAKGVLHEVPLDSCGADSQGAIGYHLGQCLDDEFRKSGMTEHMAVAVVTQVLVDKDDPSFAHPSKPIGQFYSEAEANKYVAERGWVVKEDAGRGWRRVVASPDPKQILELEAIKDLVEGGRTVIAVGGGGIPVIDTAAGIRGIAAVIDKDFASALLANDLGADTLIISTAVPMVYMNFGKVDQTEIREMNVEQAERCIDKGHFKPGSMLPKIEAAIRFLKAGGRQVIITNPENLLKAVRGEAGTRIVL